MTLMKFNQLMMGQIRNISRIAARIIMIGRRWEQMMGDRMIKLVNLAAHCAFHLIEHNAFKLRLIVFV